MVDFAPTLVRECNLEVLETIDVPAREERRQSLPADIVQGPLANSLKRIIAGDGTVWQHQSLALQHLCDGDNVVIATGTASGKSLIFQLYALHHILQNQNARALIFYPLKALSSDQFERWQQLLVAVGLTQADVVRIDGDMKVTAERAGGHRERASELGVLASQCLARRIADKQILAREVTAWQDHRNKHHAKANCARS